MHKSDLAWSSFRVLTLTDFSFLNKSVLVEKEGLIEYNEDETTLRRDQKSSDQFEV